MLKTVYAGNYNAHIAEIQEGSHIRAWGEQVLIALVLKLLTDKLIALMTVRLLTSPLSAAIADLSEALASFRDRFPPTHRRTRFSATRSQDSSHMTRTPRRRAYRSSGSL